MKKLFHKIITLIANSIFGICQCYRPKWHHTRTEHTCKTIGSILERVHANNLCTCRKGNNRKTRERRRRRMEKKNTFNLINVYLIIINSYNSLIVLDLFSISNDKCFALIFSNFILLVTLIILLQTARICALINDALYAQLFLTEWTSTMEFMRNFFHFLNFSSWLVASIKKIQHFIVSNTE